MKKLLARLPVIIIGIPAVYWLLVKADNPIKLVFFAIIAILGQYELCSMLEKGNRKPILEWISSIIMLTGAFWGERVLFACLTGSVVLAMITTVFRGLRGDGIKYFCHFIFSIFYLPFCLSCFYLLSLKLDGMALFLILSSVWALDIGAYIFGMSIRGPKLAPKISPNKTISGAIGGFICSVAFLYSAAHYGWGNLPLPRTIYAALIIATVGQIADLFESVIKRESDTKDSSSLLGAHGGILDRIDSVLFLGPLCYFIYSL
ncbi:MAG: phosphatidate cytidylyltransferase [Candidatus Riflebacteria bacterium]|nr:phosphatidate cytidylyltransferase [Candidatus Riflebacteria bacterium]